MRPRVARIVTNRSVRPLSCTGMPSSAHGGAMDRGQTQTIEGPSRGGVSPWVEISAWILAFAILLAAQCAPERASTDESPPPAAEAVQR